MKKFLMTANVVAMLLVSLQFAGCSTQPKQEKKDEFRKKSSETLRWFKANVDGLEEQIDNSAGYIVFPDVMQFGLLISGGTWGRGALYNPTSVQKGWSAINVGSVGLQAGVQGFRMLMVLENQETLDQFMANKLTGSVVGVVVAGDGGGSGKASFTNGVAIYQGANKGLMAGVNVGLNYVRYHPLEAPEF